MRKAVATLPWHHSRGRGSLAQMKDGALRRVLGPQERVLLVAAAPLEARALLHGVTGSDAEPPAINWEPLPLDDHFDLLASGVGKANAAAALGRTFTPDRYRAIINLGVAGVLPGRTKVKLGESVLATESVYADEGCVTPETFLTMARLRFGPGQGTALSGAMGVRPAPWLRDALTDLADHTGPVATVSTCSGRNRVAMEYTRRTDALVEAMEGAAAAFTIQRLTGGGTDAPFAELRVVSNTTGSRGRQRWDLAGALARLTGLASRL